MVTAAGTAGGVVIGFLDFLNQYLTPKQRTLNEILGATHRAKGPLSGVLVISNAQILSASYCVSTLRDQGATVITFERLPEGDPARGYPPYTREKGGQSVYHMMLHYDEYSIGIDFNDEENMKLLRKLFSRADGYICNPRPGTQEKFGLGPKDLRKDYPHLIITNISGDGYNDPEREGFTRETVPSYDLVSLFKAGFAIVNSYVDEKGQIILKSSSVSLADLSAGLHAAIGFVSALYDRAQNKHNWLDKGAAICVSMRDAMWNLLRIQVGAASNVDLELRRSARGLSDGHGSITPFAPFPCGSGTFMLDGEEVTLPVTWIAVCAGNNEQFKNFATAIDLGVRSQWENNAGRKADEKNLHDAIIKKLATKSNVEWAEILSTKEINVPNQPFLRLEDVVNNPELANRFKKILDKETGEQICLGPKNAAVNFEYPEAERAIAPGKPGSDDQRIKETITDEDFVGSAHKGIIQSVIFRGKESPVGALQKVLAIGKLAVEHVTTFTHGVRDIINAGKAAGNDNKDMGRAA